MSLFSAIRTVLTLGRGIVHGLPDATADRDPIALFGAWFAAARRSGILLPEAMALATCGADCRPSSRMVLLKDFDANGFVFYTNYESRKSLELEANPHAALLFHWAVLQRQVRIEGPVTRLSPEESEGYFHSRPRGSQIGAWASKQSRRLDERRELEARMQAYEREFEGRDVPLPPFWGGFRVFPRRIEFWQGRTHRLHDRLLFVREGDAWQATRLYP